MTVYIEVPSFFLTFSFALSGDIKTNLMIYRACYVSFGYNKSECALLGGHDADNQTAHLEETVEPYVNVLNMIQSVADASLATLLCLFLGPGSDRYGRKPVLIVTAIGFTLQFAALTAFAVLEDLSPWYSLLSSLPVYLTGGGSSHHTVLSSYITDITTEDNRGMRMIVMAAVSSSATFLGKISSSYVLAATSYELIFAISTVFCLTNVLLTAILIPESLSLPNRSGRLWGFLQVSNIKDMVTTTFRRRTGRGIILVCLVISTINTIANGNGSLLFMYLRDKLQWSLQDFTVFSAVLNIVGVFGTITGTYLFHNLLKIPEIIMILLGCTSSLFGALVMPFVRYDWEVYTVSFVCSLCMVLTPMVRSLVSKLVLKEEIGKIFSLVVVSEALFGMAGSPIFTAIYNATISTNPALFYFAAAGFYALEISIVLGTIGVVWRDGIHYREMEVDNEECYHS